MSIKYNQFGEVVSVNGVVTGHYLGKPMQDAVAERPEDNEPYAREQSIVTNSDKVDNDFTPPMSVMVVNFVKNKNENTVTADKTFDEMTKHLQNGGKLEVWFKVSSGATPMCMYLRSYDKYTIHYFAISCSPNSDGTLEPTIFSVSILQNNTNVFAKSTLEIV